MKRNPAQEAAWRREDAARCFVRASALLGEIPTTDVTGEALFWAALGMLRLAQSDPDERAHDRALAIVRSCTEV